jgi:hypothetical protein
LSCKKLRGRFVRHDVLVNVLAKMCSEAGLTVTTEVLVIEGKQMRMDLVIHLPGGRVWIDVSVVNPLVAAYIRTGDPKREREKEKKGKWGAEAKRRGITFVPFIVDTFGGIGPSAKSWLQEIAGEARKRSRVELDSRMISPMAWEGQYRWKLAGEIGVALAHANWCMVEEAKIKCEFPRAETRGIYAPVWARGTGVYRVRSANMRGRVLFRAR